MKEKGNASNEQTHIISHKKSLFGKKKQHDSGKDFVNVKQYDDNEFYINVRGIDVYAAQILGTRQNQEDSYAVSSDSADLLSESVNGWAVVCDGMGGLASGEVASGTAVEIMRQILQNVFSGDSIPTMLSQAISIANDEVRSVSGDMAGESGTTLVCAIAKGNMLYYASVGDSRIYLCRGNEIIRLTRDHNYAMELAEQVAAGKISEEDALCDPQRNALISYIGIENLEIADVCTEPVKMQDGDIVLLCSDGLTGVLSDGEILAVIKANQNNIRSLTESLLSEVMSNTDISLDNTTVAVLKYINN